MHPNPAFRGEAAARNLAFARARGFGALCLAVGGAPLIAHIPFVLASEAGTIGFHLARSNPIARALKDPQNGADGGAPPEPETEALIAVTGPDAYVSPDWYVEGPEQAPLPDQVPTWNYVAVHLRGSVRLLEDAALRPHLDAASALFEAQLAPKRPWGLEKMTQSALRRLERAIVPAEMTITRVEGTWKLSQNKPEAARRGAADGVAAANIGSEAASAIAALMRESLERG